MKTLHLSTPHPIEIHDLLRRLFNTFHKRNCYPARGDVTALVAELRTARKELK